MESYSSFRSNTATMEFLSKFAVERFCRKTSASSMRTMAFLYAEASKVDDWLDGDGETDHPELIENILDRFLSRSIEMVPISFAPTMYKGRLVSGSTIS